MRDTFIAVCTAGLFVVAVCSALAQPADAPPVRNEVVRISLLQPDVYKELDLTDDQVVEISKLEAETQARLMKILTKDQKQKLRDTRPIPLAPRKPLRNFQDDRIDPL